MIDQVKEQAVTAPEERLLRVPEVAEALSVKPIVAYRLIWSGELPAIKFRRSVRIKREDLASFIDSHRSNGSTLEASQ